MPGVDAWVNFDATATIRPGAGADLGAGPRRLRTIVLPSSPQYSFAWCQLGTTSWSAADGNYENTSSNHPGGCNFLFADGGVHFLKSSINIKTYWAMGTKAGGEITSSDSY